MKYFKKNLALLLAGALLMTSLIACSDDELYLGDNTGNLLTPEAFSDVLHGDQDMIIVLEATANSNGKVQTAKSTTTRDGNKVLHSIRVSDSDYVESYFDFETNCCLYHSDSGSDEWASLESPYDNWDDLVEGEFLPEFMDPLFDNNNYNQKGDRYELNDESAKAFSDVLRETKTAYFNGSLYGEHPVIEAYVERKGSSNVFYYKFASEDDQTISTVKIIVTPGSTTVTLPEIE